LRKLKQITEYLTAFRLEDWPDIVPIRVVDGANATRQLTKAAGDQVLAALPEASEHGGDTDTFTESVSMAFFVLANIDGSGWTPALADTTYLRLLEIATDIIEKLETDITGGDGSTPCPLLSGLSLTDVQIFPEYSVFGGWSGWSLSITLD